MKIKKQYIKQNYTPLKRTKKQITYIVCHYVGALGSAQNNADYYSENKLDASADFFVGHEGEIIQTNDYLKGYSWHCGGGNAGTYFGLCTNSNSIGIEMCVRKRSTDTMNAENKDWYFEDATITACAELVASKMKELDIDSSHVIRHYDVNYKECPAPFVQEESAWNSFKNKVSSFYKGTSTPPQSDSYYRVGKSWKNNKCVSQSGAYTYKQNAIDSCKSGYKVFDSKGKCIYPAQTKKGTQPEAFSSLTEKQAAAKILQMAKKDNAKSGILASVTAAQMILESGYVKTDLALKACNCFGMKTTLSGNSWSGSSWDGKSKFTKVTKEEYTPGIITNEKADFRKYSCLEDSVSDHSAYLKGAKNGADLRYAGLTNAPDYKQAITIIKNGGYATDSQYIEKICSIIARFQLDKYDKKQVNPSVPKQTFKSYMIQVSESNLRIRSGAGIKYTIKGYTGIGSFTIVDEKKDVSGQTWGLLKAYEKGRNGWVAMWAECVKKV